MTEKDYYELLEVSREASGEEIKKSYRRLAMKYLGFLSAKSK